MFWVHVQKMCGQLLSLSQVHFYIFRIHLDNKNMREKIRYAYEYQNKLASLEATLVRNIDRLTHSLTHRALGVKCTATSIAKNLFMVSQHAGVGSK